MSSAPNRLAKTIYKIDKLAGPFRQQAVTLAIGRTVKFVGTTGLGAYFKDAQNGSSRIHCMLRFPFFTALRCRAHS